MYVQIVSKNVITNNDIVPNYFVMDDQNRDPNRSYRKQCGTHVFVDGTKKQENDNVPCEIQRQITCWRWDDKRTENKWKYGKWSKKTCPMSCLYPSVRPDREGSANTEKNPELLLGVFFCSEETNGNDYYRRSYERKENNGRSRNVRNITQSFKEQREENWDYHYNNVDLFPTNDNREAVAVYVCRGARVMLFDDSLYEWNEEKNTLEDCKYEMNKDGKKYIVPKHCRSLCQQGSLIVVSNCKLQLTMQIYIGDHKQYFNSWMNHGNENPILPDIYTGEPPLCRLQKKVLFIGANDSMHNSICWQLKVMKNNAEQIRTYNCKYYTILEAPEGGRLLDVANWNEGFEQIYWRHRYERLVESVVAIDDQNSQSLDFQLPANDLLMRRIHGIENANQMNVPFPIPVPNGCTPLPTTHWRIQYDPNRPVSEQIDCDVRRYIDYSRYSSADMPSVVTGHRGKGYDKWTQVNLQIREILPPPPLYPIYRMRTDGSAIEIQYLLKRGIYVLAEIKNQKVYCHIDWSGEPNEAPNWFNPINYPDNYRLFYGSKFEFNVTKSPRGRLGLVGDRHYRLSSDMVYYDQEYHGAVVGKVNKWYLVRE